VDRATPEATLLEDLEIRLARDLLVAAPLARRSEMLPHLERLASGAK
jgi:hypothetical protein